MADLTFNTYGKTDIRLTQVMRDGARHEVVELSAKILFEGDFAESYTNADNSKILPTDTMKNTVYAVARQHPVTSIEEFARDLARHFLASVSPLKTVKIEILQTPWAQIGNYGSAFIRNGEESRMTALTASRTDEVLVSGIRNLEILKTGNSAFSGYMTDELTTLPETRDRLLGTILDADWIYRAEEISFNECHTGIRQVLLNTFATHKSESVQHTLFTMADAALKEFNVVKSIHLVMPNRHRLLVDLLKFGLDNPNQVFVATDEPSGYIEARVARE
jgi:urate oxidase